LGAGVALGSFVAWLSLLTAPPLRRDYEGARAVLPVLARRAPAPAPGEGAPTDAPPPAPAQPPAEPAPDPALPPEPTTAAPADAPASAPADDPMADIFGTDAEHEDVKDLSTGDTKGPTTAAEARKAAAASTRASKRQKFLEALDTRVRVVSSAYYDVHKVEKRGFGRNENRLEFYFAYTPDRHLQIVGDIEPVFYGLPQARELDDLATVQMLTPFHIESDAAYIAIFDLVPNLDIKVGRQIVQWGTADKFNPTNNINPDDLEDRPLFTEPIANQMVVVDYSPLGDKLWFQGVYVPMFYPALLPPSAAVGLKDPQTTVPYAREADQQKIEHLQDLLVASPGLVPEVVAHVHMPSRRFTSGQSAVKIGTSLGGIDMSMSYYNGRHDIPTPVDVQSSEKATAAECGAVAGSAATIPECQYRSDVTLIYPRMQVVGFDFTTQVPFLGDMGLWGEGALFFPQAQTFDIEFPVPVDVTADRNDDGYANPVMGMSGPTVRDQPFLKATAGVDYTFGKHVYVQAQYLRGFIDEFGAGHIGNYLVAGADLIFFGRHFLFRAFGVVDFPTGKGDPGSYVIYPELQLIPPWGSVNFHLGSFFLLGKRDTKFGQKAAGSSIVFFKVVGTF
jgi:hypothetical protein